MKRALLLLFCTCFSSLLFAQEGFQIGVRFSPLISTATAIQDDDRSRLDIGQLPRLGYAYGLVGSYGYSENYGLNSGILIVYRGFNAEQADFSNRVRYTAIQIPFGFKMRSNEIGTGNYLKAIFNAELEANVGYKGIETTTGLDPIEVRNPNRMNFFTAGFVIGGGLEKEIEIGLFDIGLSYHNGLLNINNKTNAYADTIIKLSYFSLDMGYFF